MKRVYIVEDDEDIRSLTAYALTAAGFSAWGFEDGVSFFKALSEDVLPDIVLFDVMLPGEDGFSLLKRLRAAARYASIPAIMLTAKGAEADRVKGLNLGADDYVLKPFGVTELIARINAVLRRAGAGAKEERFTYKNLALDEKTRLVTVNGSPVQLTFTEFELLRCLLLNTPIVLSRDKLMDEVWGYDYAGESRTVDMHIKALRQKLGEAGAFIKTVRNVGYKIGE